MLSNKEQLAFFHNIKNKQHLLSLFVTYFPADDFVQSSLPPILVSKENETFKISLECNHEEPDARIIFHKLQQETNVVVCSKHTNNFVLMVFVFALKKNNEKQMMKIESNKFINTQKVVEALGKNPPRNPPPSHTLNLTLPLT